MLYRKYQQNILSKILLQRNSFLIDQQRAHRVHKKIMYVTDKQYKQYVYTSTHSREKELPYLMETIINIYACMHQVCIRM